MPGVSRKQLYKDIEGQKVSWVHRHLRADVPVITCMSADKWTYATPGALLIDDRAEARGPWERAGGVFVHHTTAARSVYEVNRLFGRLPKVDYAAADGGAAELPLFSRTQPAAVIAAAPVEPSADDASLVAAIDKLAASAVVSVVLKWDVAPGSPPLSWLFLASADDIVALHMPSASGDVSAALHALLANAGVTKVVAGALVGNGSPLKRLAAAVVRNVVDVQEVVADTIAHASSAPLTLGTVCRWTLGCELLAADAPAGAFLPALLPSELFQSCADEASATLAVFHALPVGVCAGTVLSFPEFVPACPAPALNESVSEEDDAGHADGDASAVSTSTSATPTPGAASAAGPAVDATIAYCCFALSAPSQRALRAAFPPKLPHRDGCYDHVTVTHGFMPEGWEVGVPTKLAVIGTFKDAHVQAVRVQVVGGSFPAVPAAGNFHVTLSFASGSSAKVAHAIKDAAWQAVTGPALVLDAVTCVVVAVSEDPLASLPHAVSAKVKDFIATAAGGSTLEFRPLELTGNDRAVIHEYAVGLGLASGSEGSGSRRHLVLTKPRSWAAPQLLTSVKHVKVLDAAVLLRMQPRSAADAATAASMYDGITLASGAIQWSTPARAPPIASRMLYVLRGLPGSGKSQVSASLGGVTINADAFSGERELAHAQCRADARAAIAADAPVIVIDNTNMQLSEYAPYVAMAVPHGYTVCVIEFACPSIGQAFALSKRSVHDVPHDTVMNMFYRWEADPSALIVKPFCGDKGSSDTAVV